MQLSSTKITGKADVGFVKDSKKVLPQHKVKAITASVHIISSGMMLGDTSKAEDMSRKINSNDVAVRTKIILSSIGSCYD